MLAPDLRIANAFIAACSDELQALKPGNVHRYADGHGMCVDDFIASAETAAPHVACRGLRVGQRILNAVQATRKRVGFNTNLGILLLCAPLASAAERIQARDLSRLDASALQRALQPVLEGLDLEDARLAFAAIAHASPGGLGEHAEADVRAPARINLRAAMAIAASRDRIALQYRDGFTDLFATALPCLRKGLTDGLAIEWASCGLYLNLLARWPDSHLLRKFGDSVAQSVTREAREFHDDFLREGPTPAFVEKLLAWDSRLKTQALNPGTTADLTVATLFLHRLGAA